MNKTIICFLLVLIVMVCGDINYILVQRAKPAAHYESPHQLRRVNWRAQLTRTTPAPVYPIQRWEKSRQYCDVSPHHMHYGIYKHQH
jgi:hypothetical protein